MSKGTGTVFFRCISMYLFGTEEFHRDIRRQVVDEMEKYAETYRELIDPEESYAQHIDNMKKCSGETYTWATEAEIFATTNILGCDIYVSLPGTCNNDMNRYAPNRGGKKENHKIILRYTNEHFNLLTLPQKWCTCKLQLTIVPSETEVIDWWDCIPKSPRRSQTSHAQAQRKGQEVKNQLKMIIYYYH